ncbi:uncharacterized protein LOC122303613 [Carya illinoinensis]|uniref:GRF-type domain-containing protein n=1 Tax=Carya illinoinensis TaxID=32201 RepID=A0A8T1PW60_CARIL|nr:uncharacterized protein LOC122303613 [Carya illinoinensis]KAG6645617.1 hypothetical protein CIPAW_08G134400 [Carya illinoinensis]
MASSQSSSFSNDCPLESPSCWCGLKTRLKTSHTKSNPGRSFFACPKYDMGDTRCGFFIWTDIFNLLDQNLRTRENKVWNMWDDVLLREYEVQKREDQVRERERMLKKNQRILLWLYWVVVIVIVLAWFG